MIFLVYSSPVTKNTWKLACTIRDSIDPNIEVKMISEGHPDDEPAILFVPSYGGTSTKLVPAPVVKFLNEWGEGRDNVVGVVAAGNRNFGSMFCAGGIRVAQKLGVPLLGVAELAGQPHELPGIIDAVDKIYNAHESQ